MTEGILINSFVKLFGRIGIVKKCKKKQCENLYLLIVVIH